MSTTIKNRNEARFAADLDRQGKLWFHQPKMFPLPPPIYSYRPDFYVVENDCFYEVISTPSAYRAHIAQIDAFRQGYPHLRIEIANVGAWKRGPTRHNQKRGYALKPLYESVIRAERRDLTPLARTIVQLIREHGLRSFAAFARHIGVAHDQVRAVVFGRCSGAAIIDRLQAAFPTAFPSPPPFCSRGGNLWPI